MLVLEDLRVDEGSAPSQLAAAEDFSPQVEGLRVAIVKGLEWLFGQEDTPLGLFGASLDSFIELGLSEEELQALINKRLDATSARQYMHTVLAPVSAHLGDLAEIYCHPETLRQRCYPYETGWLNEEKLKAAVKRELSFVVASGISGQFDFSENQRKYSLLKVIFAAADLTQFDSIQDFQCSLEKLTGNTFTFRVARGSRMNFASADTDMVHRNLDKAYAEIDPGWQNYLKANFERDKQNVNVLFVELRLHGKLIALCKLKDGNYFGTHYVDEEFQRRMGFGNFVQMIVMNFARGEVFATAALANSALQRHISAHGAVGCGLVKEADENYSSAELMQFKWRSEERFLSKDWSREQVLENIGEDGPVKVFVADSTNIDGVNNAEFVAKLNDYFARGYFVTQIFYGQDGLSETYVVLEEPLKDGVAIDCVGF